jgi:hypothetical protein
MAKARWYNNATGIWYYLDATVGTPAAKKAIHFYDGAAGVWRRAATIKIWRGGGTAWLTVFNGLPASPTDATPSVTWSDMSLCTNPSPRTESWLFRGAYTISSVYINVYNLQIQFTRNGVDQGWNTYDTSSGAVNADLTGSWSSGAPHGTLGTGAGYDTAIWKIQARWIDIETGNVGAASTLSAGLTLFLPYC